MAEPEDPHLRTDAPHPHDDFDDDLVGFASPGSLSAQPRRAPEPEPPVASDPAEEAVTEPEPEEIFQSPVEIASPAPVAAPEPVQPPVTMAEPAWREPEEREVEDVPMAEPEVIAPVVASAPLDSASVTDPSDLSPRPEDAPVPEAPDPAYGQPGATREFGRPPSRRDPGITAEGDARLSLVIYGCLIAAAVTVGLSVVLALFLAWTGQILVKGWTRSHLSYQLRTSVVGVLAGIVGVVTFPLGLGVFILSLAVIWVVVRGAAGLMKLLRHEEIRDPGTWKLP